MVNDRQGEPCALPVELDFLMFCSAGVSMAVDAIQVDGIMSLEQAEQRGISVRILNEILGMGSVVSPASLKVLLYKDGEETCGVGVDDLDSIVPVPIGAIRLLPEPFLLSAGTRPFWGAVPRGNDVVLLIDLYRLKSLGIYTG
ncbi:MAG: chemotaxis protein CheW [Thermodesulfovibrionales bacterium]